MKEAIIIGVAGGSGSGKTTFANKLFENLGVESCKIIYQDNYYIDQSKKFDYDGGSVNFDHPDALDFNLLAKHLVQLKQGESIDSPIYDFSTHSRKAETNLIESKPIILVDGILILSSESVFSTLDYSFYVDCPEDLRFSRRLKRDIEERGRTEEGVRNQFFSQVKPMHDQFVEPSKKMASDIIHMGNFDERLAHWTSHLSAFIRKN